MTHRAPASRTMKVEALARVEGEGAMYVEIDGEQVTDVQLQIYEPPRFFEAFLRGGGASPSLRTSRRASAASARSPTR